MKPRFLIKQLGCGVYFPTTHRIKEPVHKIHFASQQRGVREPQQYYKDANAAVM